MSYKEKGTIYVTHCMDVEGPMNETLEATWERLQEEDGFDMSTIEINKENLNKLQDKTLNIPNCSKEKKEYLSKKYSKKNLSYYKTWEEIDQHFLKITSPDFRATYQDPQGNPYLLNMYIYDHYGFSNNPRFHAEGIHEIYDHYHQLFLSNNQFNDGIYWHYHHPPSSGDALEWNTNWFQNGIYEEILARRIIERNWFTSTFRAGGHIERNDLSFWLEMFMPFDFSSRTLKQKEGRDRPGGANDWRGAPLTWGRFHPDWYDYRKSGTMKRNIFRCLDLSTWMLAIEQEDVDDAFLQADKGESTILAYYNHDYRDMEDDIKRIHNMIEISSKQYKDVKWMYTNSLEAARKICGYNDQNDTVPNFTYRLENNKVYIYSDIELFGPEPFLAIQENDRFFRDNTTKEGPREWCYSFRKLKDVKAFGIAGNSPGGKTGVVVHKF